MPLSGFPAQASEVTRVSYVEAVWENWHLMDALTWGQEQHWVMESAPTPTPQP